MTYKTRAEAKQSRPISLYACSWCNVVDVEEHMVTCAVEGRLLPYCSEQCRDDALQIAEKEPTA